MPGIAIKIDLNELYTLANSKRWKSSEIGKIKATGAQAFSRHFALEELQAIPSERRFCQVRQQRKVCQNPPIRRKSRTPP